MAAFTRAEADAVLARALELSGAARETYLNESCGTQTPLRALIERLLEASESDEVSLQPGGGAGGPLWDDLARQYGAAFRRRRGSAPR